MPTCLVPGGRSTLSTPSSAISATPGSHSATRRWFAAEQTVSGRNLRWNVQTVSERPFNQLRLHV